jgi:type I restriction enzyme S subunit
MFGDPVVNDKGWEIKSLGHLLEDIRYGTSTPPRFSDSGYCFVRATNIKSGRIIDTEMKFISENEAERISKCRLQDGDLIIVRSGVNSGDTCVIDEIFAGQFAGYDLIITPNKALLNSIYLNELINTNYMSQVVKPLTRRAAQPHLNAEQVKNLPIVLPIVDLQNKFAIKVKRIEEQKYIVKKAIEETQYLFDSLMSEYFD